MKKYLLDTNICIHYLKRQYNLDQKIIEVGFENCYISELTLAELLFGVENGSEESKEKTKTIITNLKNLSMNE